jgi:hypothetical protein
MVFSSSGAKHETNGGGKDSNRTLAASPLRGQFLFECQKMRAKGIAPQMDADGNG